MHINPGSIHILCIYLLYEPLHPCNIYYIDAQYIYDVYEYEKRYSRDVCIYNRTPNPGMLPCINMVFPRLVTSAFCPPPPPCRFASPLVGIMTYTLHLCAFFEFCDFDVNTPTAAVLMAYALLQCRRARLAVQFITGVIYILYYLCQTSSHRRSRD